VPAAVLVLAAACGRAPDAEPGPRYAAGPSRRDAPAYRLAVHPLHNPEKLSRTYQPLIDHLNGRIGGARFELEASRDYGVFEDKIRARAPEFLLPNPWQTLRAMKAGYRVIAMAGDPRDFKGIFIVRRDGGIRLPADLKGKAVGYPSPTAVAACILPQYFLHEHGIDINTDIENRYVGSQESAIMNVYLGKTAAGAVWPPPWRAFIKDHPKESAELKVAWETPHLINNSVMVRDDVPAPVWERVVKVLQRLRDTPEGRGILAGMETARFYPSDNGDYEAVRRYIARFEKEVRPVELKK